MLFGYSKNKGCFSKIINPITCLCRYFDKSLNDVIAFTVPVIVGVLANFAVSQYQWVIPTIIVMVAITIYAMRQARIDKNELLSKNQLLLSEKANLDQEKRGLLEDIDALKGDFRLLNENYIESHLKFLSDKIGFGKNHRISVYFENDDIFYILGRFSSNPKYKKKHTIKFAINKGALSKTWEDGSFYDFKCKSFKNAEKTYLKHQKQYYGFDEDKIRKSNMKSCSFIGYAIQDSGTPIGVILFESVEQDLSDFNNLIKEIFLEYEIILSKIVRSGKHYSHIIHYDNNVDNPENEFLQKMGGKNV